MRRQGGGFGFVIMLVILAVVFYLAMNNFKSVAPEAMDIKRHNDARKAGRDVRIDEGQPQTPPASSNADAWTPAPPSRPNLSTMDQKTTEHTAAVSDAISQAN
jgi:hypothetical protein